MRSSCLSRCRRGRGCVCGAYVCDFCGDAGVTLNTTIQTRAETKRHREGDTSALESGRTQEVTPWVQVGAGHLHWLAEVLVKVAQRLAEVLVRVPQRLGGDIFLGAELFRQRLIEFLKIFNDRCWRVR